MTDRWTELADRFVDHYRTLLGGLASVKESPEAFAYSLESVCGGSGADAADLVALRNPSPSDVAALRRLLCDTSRMHFVKVLTEDAEYVPPELVADMVRGAVYTVNPSANKLWIERSIAVDSVLVRDTLLAFLEFGTAAEVVGAANAFYWFDVLNEKLASPVDAAIERRRVAYLTKFVRIDDVGLRESLIGLFTWDSDDYPETVRHLLQQARIIAADLDRTTSAGGG